jgi:hypothetical protein
MFSNLDHTFLNFENYLELCQNYVEKCMKKKLQKKGEVMYLCFYDHNFPYVVRHFNFKNYFSFAHTRFIFNAAVVWGGQVVETKIYLIYLPSCAILLSSYFYDLVYYYYR